MNSHSFVPGSNCKLTKGKESVIIRSPVVCVPLFEAWSLEIQQQSRPVSCHCRDKFCSSQGSTLKISISVEWSFLEQQFDVNDNSNQEHWWGYWQASATNLCFYCGAQPLPELACLHDKGAPTRDLIYRSPSARFARIWKSKGKTGSKRQNPAGIFLIFDIGNAIFTRGNNVLRYISPKFSPAGALQHNVFSFLDCPATWHDIVLWWLCKEFYWKQLTVTQCV